MTKRCYIKRRLWQTAIVAFFVFGFSLTAEALTVSPARLEITGDPGTTISGEIEIFNEQEGKRTFYSSAENFEPSGDSGAPSFIGAKDGLATWIKVKDSITLEFSESKKIPFTISIPKDAVPGGYFAAVFWGSQPPVSQGGGEVSIGGKIGVLVLLRVAGEVKEGGGLLNFEALENKKFFTSLPINFSYRFNNLGGDRIVPTGEIKIKNTLRITSETLPANKTEGSILPGSIRKFEVIWQGNEKKSLEEKKGFFATTKEQFTDFHFGWYTANLKIVWGNTNQTANSLYHFFIIPWQLLTITLIFLLIVGLVGKVALKKYNKWIIAQAIRTKNE